MLRRDLSIRSKLLVVIAGTTVLALLVGFGVMAWYDVNTFREEMISQAVVVAQVVGSYTVTELAFSYSEEAEKTLAKLQAIPDLEHACLYDRWDQLFAGYRCESAEHPRPPFDSPAVLEQGDELLVVQPIVDRDESYGTLLLSISKRSLRHKVGQYLRVVVLLVVALIAFTTVAAFRLQAVISRPILALAEAARRVSQDGDYSTRVRKLATDEVGSLYDAWNEMLAQIGQRQLEQAKAEAALRRSEQRFRRISEQSTDAIYVMDAEDRLVYVNPTFEQLFGYPATEVTDESFESIQLVIEENRPRIASIRESWWLGGKAPTRYQFKGRSSTGKVFDVEANTAEIVWDNQPARLGMLRDISQHKQAERLLREQQQQLEQHATQLERYATELERSNHELDQFAYVVSHDLRAPLRAITNLSTWIEEDLGGMLKDETRRQMDLLRSRVHRMESLISGILEYSRVGRVRSTVEEVDVSTLIREVVGDLAAPPGFRFKTGADLPVVLTEKMRLAQVLSNLIGNAIKHHPRDDGEVEIRVEETADHYEFAVRDDGDGIAPEYHEKIFVMFQTLQPRDRFESTGMGLAIVKKIIEDLQGRLWIESEPGFGATFRFTWPKQVPARSSGTVEEVT